MNNGFYIYDPTDRFDGREPVKVDTNDRLRVYPSFRNIVEVEYR